MNFLDSLGNTLFPMDPGMSMPGAQPMAAVDPQTARAFQQNALVNLGLGLMAARDDRQGLGHGLASAYQNAQGGYQEAMDSAFRNTLLKRRLDAEERQLDRETKQQERQDRQSAATTASRMSAALTGPYAQNQAAYLQMVRNNPDAQAALQAAGVQMGETPDYNTIAQQLGTFGQTSGPGTQAPVSTDDIREYEFAKQGGFGGSFFDYLKQVKAASAPQINPPTGYSWNPDGSLAAIAGGPADPSNARPTAENSAAAGYLGRMSNAENQLGQYTPSWKDFMASGYVVGGNAVTSMAANKAMSPEGQKYYQAASDWVRAKLRKESGASIAKDEMDKEIRTYFPVPGDSPEVIAQKENARRIATEAMMQSAGPAMKRETPTVFANDSPEAQAADQAQLEEELRRRGLLQ